MGESSEDFEVWYIGVEEAKSAHVKHCHETIKQVVGRAKKDQKGRMRRCRLKVFTHSVEIHFVDQHNTQDSMRIPTHFMQVTGVDASYKKVCFLCVSGKRRDSSNQKVGVFTFLCDIEAQAEALVTAISRAFKLDYQNWQSRMKMRPRPSSEIVGSYEDSQPSVARHSSMSVVNEGNRVLQTDKSSHANQSQQKAGFFKISKNKRASKLVDDALSKNHMANESEVNLMQGYGAHPASNGNRNSQELPDNQLPETVLNELQERLKRMKKAEGDDDERTEVFTLRMKTRQYPQLLTD